RSLAPNGTNIAIRRVDPDSRNLDVWVMDPARGTTTRFTFDPGDDGNPIWSPDGSRIAWSAFRGGANALWIKAASGGGSEEKITVIGDNPALLDWSRDGRYLIY